MKFLFKLFVLYLSLSIYLFADHIDEINLNCTILSEPYDLKYPTYPFFIPKKDDTFLIEFKHLYFDNGTKSDAFFSVGVIPSTLCLNVYFKEYDDLLYGECFESGGLGTYGFSDSSTLLDKAKENGEWNFQVYINRKTGITDIAAMKGRDLILFFESECSKIHDKNI